MKKKCHTRYYQKLLHRFMDFKPKATVLSTRDCDFLYLCDSTWACVWVCASFLFYLQYVDRNKCHCLSLITSGDCSCLLGSGTSRLNAMMFQTSTYMGFCMRICTCVYLGACLHRCIYMSRTHNTHIHAHTTHARGMSTPLYVLITHTPHTHIRTNNTDTCLSLYVCTFWDYVNGSL